MSPSSDEKTPGLSGEASSSSSPLSNKHIKEIEELRKRLSKTLKKYPAYDTDYSLQRWLRYYNYDIDVVAPKMERGLNTIACLGCFDFSFDSPEAVGDVIRSLSPSASYFPGGLMGHDKHGNIISMQPMGRARPKTLISTGRVSDLYRLSILECEASMSLLRKEETKRDRKLGVILIYDIAEFSTSMVFMSAIKLYMNNIDYLQHLFPDSVLRIYVINAPAAVNFIYQMAKLVLKKKTANKVQFLGSDWQKILKEELGEDFILPFWGGKKVADCPTGSIRMGGDVPEDQRKKILESLTRVSEEKLIAIKVPARTEETVTVKVDGPDSKLHWYFNVDSGDIDFYITLNDQMVWPRFRISTEFIPEYGEVLCREAGVYILHFDNSHSTFTGKTVSYNVEIEALKSEKSFESCSMPDKGEQQECD